MLDIQHNSERTCFTCNHYLHCKDERKSFLYVCTRFVQTKNSQATSTRLFSDLLEQPEYGAEEQSYVESTRAPDFDINSVIESVIAENSLAPPDLKINDRAWPEAKNFLDFAVGTNFLNVKPYIMQVAIATITLAEYCPKCSDLDYMTTRIRVEDSYSKFRKYVKLLEYGSCPVCGSDRRSLVHRHGLKFYDELAFCAGQRSGKSALIAMMGAYLLHRMLKLQNPNDVYGLMSSNVLHGTFVAITFGQAKENLWDPFYGNLIVSPWYSSYHLMLLEYSRKRGDELVKLKDNFVNYKHRRLLVYPASPDKRVLRGRTRWLGAIDELGWFDNEGSSKKIKTNANETYSSLGNSLRTIRSKAERLLRQGFHNVPTGYFLNISSPSAARDKIMDLVKKSQGSVKTYGLVRPTWELNPDVTRESLAEDFRRDPVVAMRDFGAQPPLSSSPFIGTPETVMGCIGTAQNSFSMTYSRKQSPDGSYKRFARLLKVKKFGGPSVMAIDAGYSNNSFAMCVARIADKRMVVDLLVEVQPSVGVPLSYRLIYDWLMGPLIEALGVQLLTADRWNSLKILSDVETDYGIATAQHSLRYQEMQLFKEYMEEKMILLPRLPKGTGLDHILSYDADNYPKCFESDPIGHFVLQALTVQDTGSQVVKGDALTDDLLRAAMLALSQLLDERHAEIWTKQAVANRLPIDVTHMAVGRGASGGILGKSTSTGQNSRPLGSRLSRAD